MNWMLWILVLSILSDIKLWWSHCGSHIRESLNTTVLIWRNCSCTVAVFAEEFKLCVVTWANLFCKNFTCVLNVKDNKLLNCISQSCFIFFLEQQQLFSTWAPHFSFATVFAVTWPVRPQPWEQCCPCDGSVPGGSCRVHGGAATVAVSEPIWEECPVVTSRWSETMRRLRGGEGADVTPCGIIRFKLWRHYVEASVDGEWTNPDWMLPLARWADVDETGQNEKCGQFTSIQFAAIRWLV